MWNDPTRLVHLNSVFPLDRGDWGRTNAEAEARWDACKRPAERPSIPFTPHYPVKHVSGRHVGAHHLTTATVVLSRPP